MTDQEIETLVNKIGEVAPDQVATFLKNPDAFDFGVLEGYSDFTDNYKNIADFLVDKPKLMAELYQQLDGKLPSKARLYSLTEKYPWINEAELKDWFDKTNKYKELYKKEREAEAGKVRRKKEVEDWPLWKDVWSSDYEKQRYINEPEKALFGEEAPALGEAPETRTAAIADLGVGTAGAVADFIPPAWLVGPALRTGRDAAYNLSDSKYAKDWNDIAMGGALDFGINKAGKFLDNARKEARIAKKVTKGRVGDLINVEMEGDNIRSGVNTISNAVTSGASDNQIAELARNLPESEYKNKLISITETKLGEPIDRKALANITNDYFIESTKSGENWARYVRQNNVSLEDNPFKTGWLDKVSRTPSKEQLTKKEAASYLYNKLADKLNRGALGQRFVQEAATFKGRGVGNVNVIETSLQKKEKEDNIDRIINNYSLLWNKKNPPPEAKDSPLIKAAWEKWSKE